jgi:hypothetical protein
MIFLDLLHAISSRGQCGRWALAHMMEMDRETLDELLHWMEAHGYVEQKSPPGTRFCSRCSICPHPMADGEAYALTQLGKRQLTRYLSPEPQD